MSLIEKLKREMLVNTLRKHKGDRQKTAKEIGVSVRTVRNWIRDFNVKEFPVTMPTRMEKKERVYGDE